MHDNSAQLSPSYNVSRTNVKFCMQIYCKYNHKLVRSAWNPPCKNSVFTYLWVLLICIGFTVLIDRKPPKNVKTCNDVILENKEKLHYFDYLNNKFLRPNFVNKNFIYHYHIYLIKSFSLLNDISDDITIFKTLMHEKV